MSHEGACLFLAHIFNINVQGCGLWKTHTNQAILSTFAAIQENLAAVRIKKLMCCNALKNLYINL